MKMTVPMPREAPPKGKVFVRMGIKTETGYRSDWDGTLPHERALDLWLRLTRRPAPAGLDEGIATAFGTAAAPPEGKD